VSGGASSLVDRAAAAAFVLGLAALVFGYGFLAGKRGLPPHDQVAAMEEAANAFYKTYLQPASRAAGDLLLPARDAGRAAEARAYAHDPARTAPGPTFLTLYTKEGFEARLVAPDGAVLHRWRVSHSQAFPEPRHLLWKAPDEFIVWHGAKPYPNGDVVFNFQDKSFPYGGGLVRLDKDSRVVWALPENTHHDVEADPGDGSLWVPGMRYRPEGLPEVPGMKPWFYEDTVLRVSADGGEVLGEVSVLKALAASYPGLLSINYEDHLRLEAQDPLHLNAAEPLPAALAPDFPGLAAGDLLVSLRSINAIAVIDPGTGRAKWALAGPFAKQHDPDWLPDGRIMLFDNRGGDPACGGSRVLEIDYATQAVTWSYDACAAPRRRGPPAPLRAARHAAGPAQRQRADHRVARRPRPRGDPRRQGPGLGVRQRPGRGRRRGPRRPRHPRRAAARGLPDLSCRRASPTGRPGAPGRPPRGTPAATRAAPVDRPAQGRNRWQRVQVELRCSP
jgi:hypothetical protein